jgi:hypothetical protein
MRLFPQGLEGVIRGAGAEDEIGRKSMPILAFSVPATSISVETPKPSLLSASFTRATAT